VELKDAIQIELENITPDDEQAQLVIKNLENFNFEDVTITVDSIFFEFSDTVSLAPFEEVNFSLPINKNEIKGLVAGEYEFDVVLAIESEEVTGSISVFSTCKSAARLDGKINMNKNNKIKLI